MTYAVDYLLRDLKGSPQLRFPGEETERAWLDYLYHAVGVNASFGPGDVQLLTLEMRRVTTGHMLLAFLFNAVIVAAAVTLAVSG